MTIRKRFTSGKFSIEFPGPTLEFGNNGITGTSVPELYDLLDLIQTALESTGNAKRINQPYTMGNPSQVNDPINKSDQLHEQFQAEQGHRLP